MHQENEEDDNLKSDVLPENKWTKCSQGQKVCLSHLKIEVLGFDVKQTEMGGGVISFFTDSPPP